MLRTPLAEETRRIFFSPRRRRAIRVVNQADLDPRVEAGRHTPSLETIARLATAIGVPTTRVLHKD